METPTDTYGMPLLILPPKAHIDRRLTNKHHPWHPNADLPEDSDADRAIRYSIVERLHKKVHSEYHRHFLGPKLPETDAEKFFLTILGRAGYITEEVLDFTNGSYKPIPFRPDYQDRINVFPDYAAKGGDGQDFKTRRTGLFLASYVISQKLEHMGTKVDQFLDAKDAEVRRELGEELINEAIHVAVDPFVEMYGRAIRQQRIIQGNSGDMSSVVMSIIKPQYISDYFDPLAMNLRAAA